MVIKPKKLEFLARFLAITIVLAMITPLKYGAIPAWAADISSQESDTATIDLTGHTSFEDAVSAAGITQPYSNVTTLVIVGKTIGGIWTEYDRDYLRASFTNITTIDVSGYFGEFCSGACSGLPVTTVIIPSDIALSDGMFSDCYSLDTLIVGGGLMQSGVVDLSSFTETLGDYTFLSCGSITTVRLPDGLVLPDLIFSDCISLDTLVVGNGIFQPGVVDLSSFTAIFGIRAFARCSALTTVKLPVGIALSHRMFADCTSLNTLVVGNDVLQPGVVNLCGFSSTLGVGLFSSCSAITSVRLPADVALSTELFLGCSGLNTLVVGNNEMQPGLVDLSGFTAAFGDWTFINCKAISTVRLPINVSVPNSMFALCSSLDTLVVGNGLLQPGVVDLRGFIGTFEIGTFSSCYAITTVILPANIALSGSMFSYCYNLDTIVVDSGVLQPGVVDLRGITKPFGGFTFEGCKAIKAVRLPADLELSTHMFYGCTSLSALYLEGSVAPSIGIVSFYDVSHNGTIYYPEGMVGVGDGFASGDFGVGTVLATWTRIPDNPSAELVQAKTLRTAAINAVLDNLVETDYTAASWSDLLAAVSDALVAVEAATTVSEVNSVMVPDALSILVTRPAYGAAASGDLNGDGFVDMSEALTIAQVVIGGGMSLTPGQFLAVDMDGDNCLTMADVVLIMRKAAGL